jgi:ParB/RepB/Spo0J family partition protein
MKRTVTVVEDKRRVTLFRVPEGSGVKHRQLGDGLTVLGDGDILVMPSRRRDGEAKCHFAEGRAPGEVDVAAAPKWLTDRATSGAQPRASQVRGPRIIETRDIPIEDIVFRDRLRPPQPENVAKLAESLKTLGQTRGITVRPNPEQDGKFIGIAGDTLFEAAKSLKWTRIRADIMQCTEVEARLWEAMEDLYRGELTALQEAEHQAECVRRIVEISRQNVAKRKVGRPKGAIEKAARDLPMKGKTQQARRKAIERGLKIAAISSEAKVAVTKAGLDDNRSGLREIAKIENAEEQLQKVQEIIKRQAKKQAKRDQVKKAVKAKRSQPAQRHPDDVILKELKTYCRPELKKTWAQASTKVKRRFLREVLKWEGGKPLQKG